MIEEIRDKNSILNLFKELNYTVDPFDEDIELPNTTKELINSPLSLISDYNGSGIRFRIYFAELSSLRRSDFRTVLEPFYKGIPK
jgi:hypothetical protein